VIGSGEVKHMKKLLLLTTLLLTHCTTPYQTKGFTGGYTEMRIAENTYRITISGNARTSAAVLDEYFLRRASEIAIENGFSKFAILGKDVDIRTVTTYTPATTTSTATIDTVAPQVLGTQSVNIQTTSSPATTSQIQRPTLVGTVYLLTEEELPATVGQLVFDAHIILSNYPEK